MGSQGSLLGVGELEVSPLLAGGLHLIDTWVELEVGGEAQANSCRGGGRNKGAKTLRDEILLAAVVIFALSTTSMAAQRLNPNPGSEKQVGCSSTQSNLFRTLVGGRGYLFNRQDKGSSLYGRHSQHSRPPPPTRGFFVPAHVYPSNFSQRDACTSTWNTSRRVSCQRRMMSSSSRALRGDCSPALFPRVQSTPISLPASSASAPRRHNTQGYDLARSAHHPLSSHSTVTFLTSRCDSMPLFRSIP